MQRLTSQQLRIATAHGWAPIDGIQAMIEQGYAQQRMWARSDASLETGSDIDYIIGKAPKILGDVPEDMARRGAEEATE